MAGIVLCSYGLVIIWKGCETRLRFIVILCHLNLMRTDGTYSLSYYRRGRCNSPPLDVPIFITINNTLFV